MTARDRMVLIGIVVLVVIAGGWMFLVSPERKQADSLTSQVESAKKSLEAAQAQLADAKTAQSKYASAYASVVSLGKAVPASQEVPSLIYQLSQATSERNIDFNSIATAGATASSSASTAAGATASASGFTELPFTFSFSGQYFSFEKLFNSLTAFTTHASGDTLQVSGRLLTIQSVKLQPEAVSGQGKSLKLSGSITATAYVLPAGESLTNGATATSPTGTAAPASNTASAPATSPAVVKVTP
jgi:Tfp pilus assembly protein PilO